MSISSQNDSENLPLIPTVPQPKGYKFFFGTVTGLIIVINTIVFTLTLWKSQSIGILSIDLEVLIRFGAKDPVLLAQGEYWRFLTPMFVHGGLLHFAFNNWALYVLGYQIEHLFRPSRYLALYLLAGIAGNITSAFWSISVSVGASGALFGLLGAGFYIEKAIQSRLEELTGSRFRRGIYTGMVIANILFGMIIPQIDNAAHLGGLFAGIVFAFVMLRVRPNRLVRRNPSLGWAVGLVIIAIFISIGTIASQASWVKARFLASVQDARLPEEKIFYLSRIILLDPNDASIRLRRLALSLQLEKYDTAALDFMSLEASGSYYLPLKELASELQKAGLFEASDWLNKRLNSKVREL